MSCGELMRPCRTAPSSHNSHMSGIGQGGDQHVFVVKRVSCVDRVTVGDAATVNRVAVAVQLAARYPPITREIAAPPFVTATVPRGVG